MAADPNSALRAELVTALAVVSMQTRGLEAILKFPISSATASIILDVIDMRVGRRDLIQAELDALDALLAAEAALAADGYPNLDPVPVLATVEQEIQQELLDFESAVGAFTVGTFTIAGDPTSITFKDQPLPASSSLAADMTSKPVLAAATVTMSDGSSSSLPSARKG